MSRTITGPGRSRTLLIGTVLLLAAGCGTSSSSSDGGTIPAADAGVDGGSGGDSDAGPHVGPDGGGGTSPDAGSEVDGGSMTGGSCSFGTGCNSIAQLGPTVAVEEHEQDGPNSAGGTFVPGTYVLTAAGINTGCDGPMCSGATTPTGDTMQATAVVTVSGSAVSMQLVVTKDGCVDARENIDLTSARGLAATQTCPGNGDGLAALFLPDCPTCTTQWSYVADSMSFTISNTVSSSEDAWVLFKRCDSSSSTTCVVPCQNGAGCNTCPHAGSMPCGCTPYGTCADDECASGCLDSNDPVCNPSTLQCVQCVSNDDCTSPDTPVCQNHVCVQ